MLAGIAQTLWNYILKEAYNAIFKNMAMAFFMAIATAMVYFA